MSSRSCPRAAFRAVAAAALAAALLVVVGLAAVTPARALEFRGSEQCEREAYDWYVELMGLRKWNATSLRAKEPISLGELTSGFGNLESYMSVGAALAKEFNPLAAAFLPYARSFSLFDQMYALPVESNTPEDVEFELPDPSTIAYAGVDDLLYMPIRQMASLIRGGAVSCTEVTRFFIDRTKALDPLLAIVTVTLYEEAMRRAAALDAELAEGKYRGALMCIPFGVKDHHQIGEEPTTYGNILYYNNVHTVKSTVVAQLMDHGAIPIAKTALGAFANGPVHGTSDSSTARPPALSFPF